MEEQQIDPATNQDNSGSVAPVEASQKSTPTGQSVPVQDNDIKENKIWAVLSYIWILSIFVLLLKKDSAYAHYHAKQGFVLFLVSVALSVIDWFVHSSLAGFAIWILQVVLLVFVIVGIVNAVNGKKAPLPLIGEMAEGMNI